MHLRLQVVESPLGGATSAEIKKPNCWDSLHHISEIALHKNQLISAVFFFFFFFIFSPAVRALPSKQMFEHMLKRHDVLFVYVGGESPLKVSSVYVTRA